NITDADVDGVSGSLGHPDCDDSLPHVYPGARELPGTGRDDTCNGEDVSAETVRELWPTGVRAPTPSPEGEPQDWNVVFITVDALRWDHLSMAGYERKTTPNLDMIARTCLVFEEAWAASNYPATSLYRLFTGLYPSAFLEGMEVIARPGIELGAQLARAGYNTEAIVDIHPVPRHLLEGFKRTDTSLGIRASAAVRNRSSGSTAKELTQLGFQALKRLGESDKPFFLWMHYSEPHAEYLPHQGFDFGVEDIDLYDSEVAFADAWIGRLLAGLQDQGRFEDTLIVITSDHGEAFGEHGTRTHGQSLYEEELHVPLLIHVPGVKGKRVKSPVDLTDVLPSVLDALGRKPRFPTHGETLLPHAINGTPLRTPEAFSEARLSYARLQALRVGDEKVILDHLLGTVERYDLKADPEERDPDRDQNHGVEMGAWTDLHLSWPHTAMQSSESLPGK
ncbi:MAG: sulfatase-like hydrolase/transferase, partial [Myxococcota bacterium]|nr:sulfatase-like hydrolase/transferase [Myxococcota bacterium]